MSSESSEDTQEGPAKPFKLGLRNGLAMAAIILGATMQSIDMTIANVALPNMQGALGATIDQIAWVLTSYVVATAVGIPIIGWIASRYGQKRMLLFCLIGFTATSVFCGMAVSLTDMVIYRALQGFSSAGLLPLAQAITLRLFTRAYFARAMAIFGISMMLGPILGPTLGGYITEVSNWRWIFFINLPLGLLSIAGVWLFLDEHRSHSDTDFDFFGFAMLTVAIASLQLLLDRGETKHWFDSTEIRIYAVLVPLSFYLFLVQTMTVAKPFINKALFADRNFVMGCTLFMIVAGNMMITVALQPPMLSKVMGYPTMTVGALLAPRGLGAMIGMIMSTRLMLRIDTRWIVIAGLLFAAMGLWDLSHLPPQISEWYIVRSGFIQGIGLGLVFVQLNTIAFATLPDKLHVEGSSMFNLTRALGSSIGISVIMRNLARGTQRSHAEIAEHITPYNEMWRLSPMPDGWSSLTDPMALELLNAEITRQALMIGFINAYHWLMISALGAIVLMVFVKLPKMQQAAPRAVPAE